MVERLHFIFLHPGGKACNQLCSLKVVSSSIPRQFSRLFYKTKQHFAENDFTFCQGLFTLGTFWLAQLFSEQIFVFVLCLISEIAAPKLSKQTGTKIGRKTNLSPHANQDARSFIALTSERTGLFSVTRDGEETWNGGPEFMHAALLYLRMRACLEKPKKCVRERAQNKIDSGTSRLDSNEVIGDLPLIIVKRIVWRLVCPCFVGPRPIVGELLTWAITWASFPIWLHSNVKAFLWEGH